MKYDCAVTEIILGYAVIQFPETLISLYYYINHRWFTKESSTSYEADEKKKVRKRYSSHEDEDIQRLNKLLHEMRVNGEKLVLKSSTEEKKECSSMASIKTIIEILSKAIARIDELESQQNKKL